MLADIERHGTFVLSACTGNFGDAITQQYRLGVADKFPERQPPKKNKLCPVKQNRHPLAHMMVIGEGGVAMRRLGRRPWTGFRLRIAPRTRMRRGGWTARGRLRLGRLRPRTVALLLAFCVTAAGFCFFLERRVSPQVQALSETAAKQQAVEIVTAAVEQVLTEEQVTYERLVEYTADEGGIRSIQTKALEVNLLRGRINDAVEQAVTLRSGRLKLPLGALMGSNLFAGAGPNITVPLTMTGHALSDIRSDLSSSGVNQTMHRILMDLKVTLNVILPSAAAASEIDITVCLAETVIVGNVPGGLITNSAH